MATTIARQTGLTVGNLSSDGRFIRLNGDPYGASLSCFGSAGMSLRYVGPHSQTDDWYRFVAKTGSILTQRPESLARIFMLVVSGAIMLVAQFNNGSAAGGSGPFDGQWTGSAISTVEQCKSAKVVVTVEGMMVIGQAQFANEAPKINGTVRGDGSFGATIGWQPLTGKFNPDGFEGTFKDGDCEWKIDLQRAQPLNVRN